MEVVGRPCSSTWDIAVGAVREGEDSAPKRTQRIQTSQREQVDPGCTQRPEVQTRQWGGAREVGILVEFAQRS